MLACTCACVYLGLQTLLRRGVFFLVLRQPPGALTAEAKKKKKLDPLFKTELREELVSTPHGDGSDACTVATCLRSIVLLHARNTRTLYIHIIEVRVHVGARTRTRHANLIYTHNRGARARRCSYTHAARASAASVPRLWLTHTHARGHTHTAHANMLHTLSERIEIYAGILCECHNIRYVHVHTRSGWLARFDRAG